nr:ABC transporter permease subunit [uncultured Sphaerochaeta sp.]
MHKLQRAMFKKELLEMVRTSRLLIWVVLSAFFGILSPLTAYYLPDLLSFFGATENVVITFGTITYQDAVDQYVKNFSQIGTMVLIFMMMGSLAGEKSDGLIQFLLVRPVTVTCIITAKLASLFVLLLIGMLVAIMTMGIYTWYLFPGFPVLPFVVSNCFLLIYFFTLGTVTITLSAAVKKPIMAGIGAFGLWLIFSLGTVVAHVGDFSFVLLVNQMVQTIEGFPVEWKPMVGAILLMALGVVLGAYGLKRWEPND